ncbi:MAG: hypothetical protein Q8P02_00230 [Candidatus Micrarchaeota archaeon]|nr:hypothetical protein [Candidatus Micrarchaeota archaeon]
MKGQGVLEYALLVGVILLIVVLAVVILQSSLSQSTAGLAIASPSPTP